MREIRRVGEPLPTGACCPSLPQTPSHVSKSSATASTADITWIARPIRFAPRTGVVTFPPSIRNASEHPNTKSPLAGLTCPPPSDVTKTPFSVPSMIASARSGPSRMFVFVIRGIGGLA